MKFDVLAIDRDGADLYGEIIESDVGGGVCSGAVDLTDFTALTRYLDGQSTPACSLALTVRCSDGLSATSAVPLLQ